jgi:hypothetical protein
MNRTIILALSLRRALRRHGEHRQHHPNSAGPAPGALRGGRSVCDGQEAPVYRHHYDSTLVATGRKIMKTTKQRSADDFTAIKARLKHPKRLFEKPKFTAKIKLAATDEFGQTATDEVRFALRRCGDPGSGLYATPQLRDDLCQGP